MLGYRGGDSGLVTGGEQIEQGSAQDGEDQGASCQTGLGISFAGRLGGGEDGQPVLHRGAAEVRPRSFVIHQGPGIALDPERQQRTMVLRGQPGPDPLGHHRQPGRPILTKITDSLQQLELVSPRAREQGPDQAVLAAEQVQQDPWTGTDGRGERAQRQVRQAVLERVPIPGLQQFEVSCRRGCRFTRHPASVDD